VVTKVSDSFYFLISSERPEVETLSCHTIAYSDAPSKPLDALWLTDSLGRGSGCSLNLLFFSSR
jgi:hypothetical protein